MEQAMLNRKATNLREVSREDERELMVRVGQGSERAFAELSVLVKPLVISLARRYLRHEEDVEDQQNLDSDLDDRWGSTILHREMGEMMLEFENVS